VVVSLVTRAVAEHVSSYVCKVNTPQPTCWSAPLSVEYGTNVIFLLACAIRFSWLMHKLTKRFCCRLCKSTARMQIYPMYFYFGRQAALIAPTEKSITKHVHVECPQSLAYSLYRSHAPFWFDNICFPTYIFILFSMFTINHSFVLEQICSKEMCILGNEYSIANIS
jgi:hypothetical protein